MRRTQPKLQVLVFPRLVEMTTAMAVGTAPEIPLGTVSPLAAPGRRRAKKLRKGLRKRGLLR